MILHKREKKLSCGSSVAKQGALNNIQEGLPRLPHLPHLPMVGQNLKGYLKKHPYPTQRGNLAWSSSIPFYLPFMDEPIVGLRPSLAKQKEGFATSFVRRQADNSSLSKASCPKKGEQGDRSRGCFFPLLAVPTQGIREGCFFYAVNNNKGLLSVFKKAPISKPFHAKQGVPSEEVPPYYFRGKHSLFLNFLKMGAFFCSKKKTAKNYEAGVFFQKTRGKEAVPYTAGKNALSVKNNQVGAVLKRKTKRKRRTTSLTKTKKTVTGKDLLLNRYRSSYNAPLSLFATQERVGSSNATKACTFTPPCTVKGEMTKLFCKKQPAFLSFHANGGNPFYPPLLAVLLRKKGGGNPFGVGQQVVPLLAVRRKHGRVDNSFLSPSCYARKKQHRWNEGVGQQEGPPSEVPLLACCSPSCCPTPKGLPPLAWKKPPLATTSTEGAKKKKMGQGTAPIRTGIRAVFLLAVLSLAMHSKKGQPVGRAPIRSTLRFLRKKGGREHLLRLKEKQFFFQKSNSSKTKNQKKESLEEPFQLRSLVGIRSSSSSYENIYDFRIAFKNRLIPREYSLETFHRSNQDTCLLHNPAVFEGDWVQSGDLLADCAASSGGELSLGKNILIAYMPWEGYNFEDAILISERLVFEDVYSSIHIERYDIEIRETKYGMETITRNIPELNEKELEHLDSNGVAKLGSWIQEGDVLVGRVTPINKKVQSTYKNLLFTILQTKPESVRDSSLRAPRGMKGKIVNVQRFAHHGLLSESEELILSKQGNDSKRNKNEAQKGSPTFYDSGSSYDSIVPVRTDPAYISCVASTFSTESLEELGSVRRPDSVYSKGAQINIVYVYLAEKRKIQVGDKMAGRHGNKGIVSQVLPRQDMPFLANGTPIDMVLNPLGVPSRMNVGQIYECLLGLAAKYLGEHYKIFPFDEKYGPEASRSFVYSKLYEARKKTGSEWLFNPNCPGKTRLFDGRTGDPFDQSVTVGYAYMLKLVHLVDDKIHMRSTGPYSLVTQQPLRGRSKQGGQRLGEMEVWALEGYGAAFTLLEMLTIKSDDMTGRMTLWSNLILNKDLSIGTPESFKVLVCELQALCLDIGIFRVDSVGNLAEIESLTELP